jgi:AcrR family transcriptional regulator
MGMMNTNSEKENYVLTVALEIFLQRGFKKTSMDEIARASGLTRQGLYFHYPNKDALLKCAIEKALTDSKEAVVQALNAREIPVETRVFRVLNAWFGSYVGLFTPASIPDWELHCNRVMGDAVEKANAWFRKSLADLLLETPTAGYSKAEIQTAAEMLCICGQHWKRTLTSSALFEKKLKAAIRLTCPH